MPHPPDPPPFTRGSPRPALVDAPWRQVRAASPGGGRGDAPGRITFLGHSTVLVETDALRILTDPVLRGALGPVRRQTSPVARALFEDLDAVVVSHAHHDHLDLDSLRRIPGRPTVIVPAGLGSLVRSVGLGPVEEVRVGDRLEIDRVGVEVVPAKHHGSRGPFGPRAAAIGFVVRGSSSVYFPGDTDVFPEMARLAGTLDVALLPVWGWGPTIGTGHMDPGRAVEAAAILRPALAIPIHWGTLYPVGLLRLVPRPFREPGPVFAAGMARHLPEIAVRVLAPGESIELPRTQRTPSVGGPTGS